MDNPQLELERTREQIHVLLAQRGEADSFRWLVDTYEQRLNYYLRRFVEDGERALDVAQEVWLTVFRKINGLKSPEAFRVWLYRIAHDKGIDHLRVSKRLREMKTEQVDALSEQRITEDAEFVERVENAEMIHMLLSELTAEHREVLTLRFLEEMSLEEISEVTKTSLGTVKSRLHYARGTMRKLIEERSHD